MPRQLRTLQHGGTFHTLQTIPGGDPGVAKTLQVMRDLVRTWRVHPMVRNLAKQITRACPPEGWACEVATLHAWVRDQIKYVRDVYDVETVQAPDVTLRDRSGDCDDQSVLLAALLQSIGHPVRFAALGFHPGAPFSHVLCEARIGGYWRPCETTRPWRVGQYPTGVKRRYFQHV